MLDTSGLLPDWPVPGSAIEEEELCEDKVVKWSRHC